jgi:hypothetical protein
VSPAGGEVGIGDLGDIHEWHGVIIDSRIGWVDSLRSKRSGFFAAQRQEQRQQQIPCGNDNQKRQRQEQEQRQQQIPSGMTTKKTKAIARAKATANSSLRSG